MGRSPEQALDDLAEEIAELSDDDRRLANERLLKLHSSWLLIGGSLDGYREMAGKLAAKDEELEFRAALTCAHCEKRPATCVGAYEGDTTELPACDECCGHGNEDGHCCPIADLPAKLTEARVSWAAVADERDVLKEERKRLGEAWRTLRGLGIIPHGSEPARILDGIANETRETGE